MIEALVFPCTYKCDGRCIMCTIHKRKGNDLPITFFEPFFNHPEIRNLKSINITGGEPTLRKDLPQLVAMIVSKCNQLRELIINTNGFQTEVIVEQIKDVYKLLPKKTKLWVYVSLDAVNNIAERIRGVKDAHRKAINTIFSLKQLQLELAGFKIGLSCTITSQNYDQLNSVYQFAVENDIYSDFIYASVNTAYINSEPNKDLFVLSDSQRATVISFFENLLSYEKLGSSKEYYEYLLNTLNGITTNRSCIFREKRGLLLEADGNVRLCGMADKSLLGNLQDQEIDDILRANVEFMNEVCSSCQTDSYFSWTREAQESISNEMFENLVERKKRGS